VGEVLHGSLLQLLLEHCDFVNIDISQGSVATYLRCGGIFKHKFVANLPVSLPVKEFWKSVNIWGSYGQEFGVLFFWDTVYIKKNLQRRTEDWPHHGPTFSIYLCPLLFWQTLPREVLSTSWCCPSRPCVAFLACVHLALFLALSLSTGNSLVSSWCDHGKHVTNYNWRQTCTDA